MRRLNLSVAIGGGLGVTAAIRLVSELRVVLTAPESELIRRTPDDAWYYLTVARNMAAGHGATFDGRDHTNGFQPLWQSIEAALATVWHGTALVRASFVTGELLTVLAVAALVLVMTRVMRLSWIGAGLIAVLVMAPPVWSRLCDGMETPTVVATLVALAVAVWWWWNRPSVARFAVVGAASGLCCLSRTSTAVVVVLVPVLLLGLGPVQLRSRATVRQALAWLGGAGLVAAPWVVWSWWAVGSPIQVSSRVKWHWARAATGSVWSRAGLKHAWAALTEEAWRQVRLGLGVVAGTPSLVRRLAEVVAAVVVIWVIIRVVRRSRRSLTLIVPALVLVARVVVEFITLPTLVSGWYAAPLLVVSAATASAGVVAIVSLISNWVGPSSTRTVLRMGLGAVAVAFGVWVTLLPSGRPSGTWGIANLEAGHELGHLDGRAGAFDAGVVGWVHPGTVNLDGLVRSPRSVDRLLHTPPGRVAIDDDVRFLVGRMRNDDPRVPSCARRVWTSPTDVALPGQGRVPVGIWSVSACRR